MEGYDAYYNVFVNGELVQVFSTERGKTEYSLSRHFKPDKTTQVLVTKRTEATYNSASVQTFLGIKVDPKGSLVELPAAPERRLEFLGDSITCGSSISLDCSENNWLTYGPIASRFFGGEEEQR